jgi:hypothetical protein
MTEPPAFNFCELLQRMIDACMCCGAVRVWSRCFTPLRVFETFALILGMCVQRGNEFLNILFYMAQVVDNHAHQRL